MFKDIYKAANDDIKPDPYLVTRILNKSQEQQKPAAYSFRFATIAAVIAIALILPGIMDNPQDFSGNVLENDILPTADSSTTYSFISIEPADDVEHKTSTNASVENYSAEEPFSANQENTTVLSDEITVVMSVNTISPVAETASIMRSSGGGSSAVITYEELSAEQYFESIGFSPDTLLVPENLTPDFTPDTLVTISKREDEIISNENTFTYSGENFLSVTTSSSDLKAMSYFQNEEYGKSIFGNKNAVILFDGSIYQAHIIHSSGTALEIVTDLPEETLKNLLISAAKQ